MKNLILLLALALFCHAGKAQTNKLKDGFYEVYQLSNDSIILKKETKNVKILSFNKQFKEDAPKDYNRVAIYTNEFVPLELQKLPELENKTGLSNKLQITLTPSASAMLKSFTETRVMKQVAIVMDGEVLTVHKIRTVITGPGMEISRCNDKACEKLQVMMSDNVKR